MLAAGEDERRVARSETVAAAACESGRGAARRERRAGRLSLLGQAPCRALSATPSSARLERRPQRSARAKRSGGWGGRLAVALESGLAPAHVSARRPPPPGETGRRRVPAAGARAATVSPACRTTIGSAGAPRAATRWYRRRARRRSGGDSSELSRTSPRAHRQCSGHAAEHASRACAKVTLHAARRAAERQRTAPWPGRPHACQRKRQARPADGRRCCQAHSPGAGTRKTRYRRSGGSRCRPLHRRRACRRRASPRQQYARSRMAAAAACEGGGAAAERERRASGRLAPRASALPASSATLLSTRPERQPRRSAK